MDQKTRKLPEHYYKTMYLDGFTPEEILTVKRRDMRAEYEAQTEEPMDVNIRTEVKTK
jgi:hypothetical protein